MLAVYGLSCNGLREPRGVVGNPRFSWRLGSDRAGASQVAYRITVTSMSTGDVVWDSGKVCSNHAEARYAGNPLVAEDQYVWFVAVWDDAGEQAYSTPSAFLCGGAQDDNWIDWVPQRRGMVWTSDEKLNQVVEEASQYDKIAGTQAIRYVWDAGDDASALYGPNNQSSQVVINAWTDVVGLVEHAADFSTLRIEPPRQSDLELAQGALLIPQGLLLIRWELQPRKPSAPSVAAARSSAAKRGLSEHGSTLGAGVSLGSSGQECMHDARRLQVSIPPGVRGTLVLGNKQVEVVSGQHELCELDGKCDNGKETEDGTH